MAGPRILVIDDDINILSTLRILFQREGFQVQTAFDGEDGLKKIIAGNIDIILSDIDMPKMNGFEVFQKLRMQGLVQQFPMVMMSAGVGPVERAKYIEEGAEDFIVKPFNAIELLARMRRILSRVAGQTGQAVGSAGPKSTEPAHGSRPQELTRGKLGDIQVPDLVQFFLLGQKDGFLELTLPAANARMFFVGGQIIHCTVVERSGVAREGEDAVFNMLAWTEGNFRAAFERVAMPRRIRTPTHELLLEHARRSDDLARSQATAPPAAAPPPQPGPGPGRKDDFNF
ncbi:MAG: response regulator [Planctomycetaceae bacterium]|nr:response regulator [Planctomycetota bacterium]NUN52897.1 response regulator [Planctomycetaceae bacterium]